MTREIIFGPPGTGKTTTLMERIGRHIMAGVPPERMGFVSFTNQAADVAVERVCAEFGLQPRDFPHFRTIHSMCYRQLGLAPSNVMGRADWDVLGDLLGLTFSQESEDGVGGSEGDRLRYVHGYAASREISLEAAWREVGEGLELQPLQQFANTLAQYQKETDKLTFNDMLTDYVRYGRPLDVDVFIVDEAQDLSDAQWDACELAGRNAAQWYVAGDDDQAIFGWAGSSPTRLLNLVGDEIVLQTSHRLPVSVWNHAHNIAGRIGRRKEKVWRPKPSEGRVAHLPDIEQLPLGQGSWMLLARNEYLLSGYRALCKELGLLYTDNRGESVSSTHKSAIGALMAWERGERVIGERANDVKRFMPKAIRSAFSPAPDEHVSAPYDTQIPWWEMLPGISPITMAYYRRVPDIMAKPQIRISTIHGSKGGEAEHVALLHDMSYRSYRGLEQDPDSEHRVFYVGATRASETLTIIEPSSRFFYQ